MNDYSHDKNKIYNGNFRIIYLVLFLITTLTVGMSAFPSQYIYPRFEKQLLKNAENEAVRAGKHLMKTVLGTYSDGTFIISDQLKLYFDNVRLNFNLWKIKIYSPSGKIVYSTCQEEIGEINT